MKAEDPDGLDMHEFERLLDKSSLGSPAARAIMGQFPPNMTERLSVRLSQRSSFSSAIKTDAFVREFVSGISDIAEFAGENPPTIRIVHGPSICDGHPCPFHHPTDHPLKEQPLALNEALQLVLRRCGHQGLHPDLDSLAHVERSLGESHRGHFKARVDQLVHQCCAQQCCGIPPEHLAKA